MEKTWKACLAELIATFTLVFVGVGSICLDATKGGVGLVGIALAHGLAITVMVAAIGHISGGHINPAVTFGVWLAKKIPTGRAAGYVIAQLAGAALGAWFLTCFYHDLTALPTALGTPLLAETVTFGQGAFLEAVLTFFLVFVIFGSAIDGRGAKVIAPLAIGLAVTLDILVGGPLTGAAMNPARAFGPALISGYWTNHSVYWVGPLIGGGLGALVYKWAFLKK
ncbi:MAG: MIP family channel protein [Deltaproteobacteria bacterium]|nr:MIP family channel protein [Deltaproteobacteria bacterium]